MLRSLIRAAALLMLATSAARAADASVSARVECAPADKGYFAFSAGKDRCWEPINGKVMVPKAVLACAVKRSDGSLNVTFHFSEAPAPECDNGKVATREQAAQALPLLGPKERAFFSSHVETK